MGYPDGGHLHLDAAAVITQSGLLKQHGDALEQAWTTTAEGAGRERGRPSAGTARAHATARSGIAVVLAALVLVAGCSDAGGHRGGPPPSHAASTGLPFDPKMRAVECQFTDNEAVVHSASIKLARGDKEAVAGAYTYLGRRLALLAVAPGGTPEFAEVLGEWAGESTEVAEYVAKTPKGAKIDYGPAYPRWAAAKKTAERLCGHEFPKGD